MAIRSLPGPNAFKLGLFGLNTDGGIAITKVPERWRARWDEIAEVARMVDEAGFDFLLPVARWKGYGGQTNVRHACFETLTQSAGLAALTKRLFIFSTVHVPLVHPVFAAKYRRDKIFCRGLACGTRYPDHARRHLRPVPGRKSL